MTLLIGKEAESYLDQLKRMRRDIEELPVVAGMFFIEPDGIVLCYKSKDNQITSKEFENFVEAEMFLML